MKKNTEEASEASEASGAQEEEISEVKTRKIVVPGEVIVSGDDYLPSEGARRENDNVVASRFGLAEVAGRVVKVIQLFGAFVPRRGNVVIGRVSEIISGRGWLVDIDCAAKAFLPLEEFPRFVNKHEMDQHLKIGEVICAKIWNMGGKGIDLSMRMRGFGKIEDGFIFHVIASRVPRIIGREGSMINLIKEKTGCDVTVGQNGWVWLKGASTDEELKARQAIEFVASKVFVDGLTEKMEEWFAKHKK